VIDGESKGAYGDCDKVICAGYTRRRVIRMRLTEWRTRGADSTGKVMHMWKSGWWFLMRRIQMVELGWQQMRTGFYM